MDVGLLHDKTLCGIQDKAPQGFVSPSSGSVSLRDLSIVVYDWNLPLAVIVLAYGNGLV